MSVEIAGVSQTRTLRRLANGDEAVSIPIPYKISRLHGIKPNMLCKYLWFFQIFHRLMKNNSGTFLTYSKMRKRKNTSII